MSQQFSTLSVAEIRACFLAGSPALSTRLLAQLKADPRQGVRQVYERLKRRQERARRQERREESLLRLERSLWAAGLRCVAGADEVGIGPLAGPVVAAAVIFPPHTFIPGVDDSKRLQPEARHRLSGVIRARALSIGVGVADLAEIEELNIYHAGLLAMKRAVENLTVTPQHLLVDARRIPGLSVPQESLCKGDQLSFSIAAASIVAKAWRDQLMVELAASYPQYGFSRHMGYGTPEHQRALREHGPCPLHRRSFPFVQELCGELSSLFYYFKKELSKITSESQLKLFEREFGTLGQRLSQGEGRRIRQLLGRCRRSLKLS